MDPPPPPDPPPGTTSGKKRTRDDADVDGSPSTDSTGPTPTSPSVLPPTRRVRTDAPAVLVWMSKNCTNDTEGIEPVICRVCSRPFHPECADSAAERAIDFFVCQACRLSQQTALDAPRRSRRSTSQSSSETPRLADRTARSRSNQRPSSTCSPAPAAESSAQAPEPALTPSQSSDEPAAPAPGAAPRRRGRPLGSKNRGRAPTTGAQAVPSQPEPTSQIPGTENTQPSLDPADPADSSSQAPPTRDRLAELAAQLPSLEEICEANILTLRHIPKDCRV